MSTDNHVTMDISSGDILDVRAFTMKQGINRLFHIDVRAVSKNLDIDFDDVIGKPATFSLRTGNSAPTWQGICSQIEQVRVDAQGLATYLLTIHPRAWLMTQRKNYRIFQYETELDIVKKMLGEWGVDFEARVDTSNYKARKYRCQYGETDFAFISRMLEDAGASYYFEDNDGKTMLVLDDAPHTRELTKPRLHFHDEPSATDQQFVTRVSIRQRVRPGKVVIGDLDYRKPSANQPRLSASGGLPQEQELEQFHFEPGAFLYKQEGSGGSTPTADDRGSSRTDEQLGRQKTQNRLHGERGSAKCVTFESNALDLVPGVIMSVINHPHRVLSAGRTLLVTEAMIEGNHDSEWRVHAEVVPTDCPFKPEMKTTRPKVNGLESATVVGPEGEEIHTDEYGRVRVQFHWDREGKRDETSSCWIPCSQPWAGAGFGGVNLPRIGQEVLVEFLGGDPDRPVVVGRVFTETLPPPYKLPEYKKVSGLRSESSPRLVMGGADGVAGVMEKVGGLIAKANPLGNAGLAEVLNHPFFGAKSPDQQTHSWRGNEISFCDQPNKQQLYMQAERDMNCVVKKTQMTVIGDARTAFVKTDDICSVMANQRTFVGGSQSTIVGGDRSVLVMHGMKHDVVGDISVQGHANQTFDIARTFKAKAEIHHIECTKRLILEVGQSKIVMLPDCIVIQSVDVFINPGEDDAKNATNGYRPETPEEKKVREEKEQARARALRAWKLANESWDELPVAGRVLMTPENQQYYMRRFWNSGYEREGGILGTDEADALYNWVRTRDYRGD